VAALSNATHMKRELTETVDWSSCVGEGSRQMLVFGVSSWDAIIALWSA